MSAPPTCRARQPVRQAAVTVGDGRETTSWPACMRVVACMSFRSSVPSHCRHVPAIPHAGVTGRACPGICRACPGVCICMSTSLENRPGLATTGHIVVGCFGSLLGGPFGRAAILAFVGTSVRHVCCYTVQEKKNATQQKRRPEKQRRTLACGAKMEGLYSNAR